MLPGADLREQIRATVREVVTSRHGAAQAITGDDLAIVVRLRLDMDKFTLQTVKRRVQEAVADLREKGEPIGSYSAVGYFTIETEEERQATLRDLRHRIASTARVMRALDRHTAERVQLALEGM